MDCYVMGFMWGDYHIMNLVVKDRINEVKDSILLLQE